MLTLRMRLWLRYRSFMLTDAEACRAAGIEQTRLAGWKSKDEFKELYEDAVEAGVDFMRQKVEFREAHVDHLADLGLATVQEVLEEGKAETKDLLKAAEIAVKAGGLMREKGDTNINADKMEFHFGIDADKFPKPVGAD